MTDERLQSMEQNAGNWNTAGCLEFVAEVKRLRAENEGLKEPAAFGWQCYQDRCENAYIEASVVKGIEADNARLREALKMALLAISRLHGDGQGKVYGCNPCGVCGVHSDGVRALAKLDRLAKGGEVSDKENWEIPVGTLPLYDEGNDERDAEIERLRLALGESEAVRKVLEESSLTKAHRALVHEADIYRRERDRACAELAAFKAEIESGGEMFSEEPGEWHYDRKPHDTHRARLIRIEELK